jgi:hypothetical protein
VFLNVSRSLVTRATRVTKRCETSNCFRATRARDWRPRKLKLTRHDRQSSTSGDESDQDETWRVWLKSTRKGACSRSILRTVERHRERGFDLANFFPDMIASFDPVREAKRPSEYAESSATATAAREARRPRGVRRRSVEESNTRESALVRDLSRLKTRCETRITTKLRALTRDVEGVSARAAHLFALGQTASLAAMDATDEQVQAERLNRALGHYRMAVAARHRRLTRHHVARARVDGTINAFLENTAEAVKEFDEAIKLGDVRGGAIQGSARRKKKLSQSLGSRIIRILSNAFAALILPPVRSCL